MSHLASKGRIQRISEHFDVEQLKRYLVIHNLRVNRLMKAYDNLLEVRDGKIIVKKPDEFRKFIVDLRYYVTDEKIDEIIEQAGYLNGRRSVRDLEKELLILRKI